jgi:hypothetical protein
MTVAALFAQPDNAGVLHYLNLPRPEDVGYFEAGVDGSPFDEGGQIFFHRYGRGLPTAARCSLELCNILVHERTARIFALHEGRFTIALRRDFSRRPGRYPLQSETLDGPVDLTLLGRGWMLLCLDEGEAREAFLAAYDAAGRA